MRVDAMSAGPVVPPRSLRQHARRVVEVKQIRHTSVDLLARLQPIVDVHSDEVVGLRSG